MIIKRFQNILNENNTTISNTDENIKKWEVRVEECNQKLMDIIADIKKNIMFLIPNENDFIYLAGQGFCNKNGTIKDKYHNAIIKVYNYQNDVAFEVVKDGWGILSFNEPNVWIDLYSHINKLYKYQKELIDKKSKKINEILPYLHPTIKKEYPHLTTGTDLNLL